MGKLANWQSSYDFCFVLLNEQDCVCKAEWNIHTTAKDKEPCDSIGDILKRVVAKTNFKCPYNNQITNGSKTQDQVKNT